MAKERIDGFTEAKRAKFLELYAQCGRKNAAARAVGTTSWTVRDYCKKHPDYDELVKEAYEVYCESLEAEIERRGKDGVLRPIFQSGMLVGHVTEYSDQLMLAHAKRHIPEYREKHSVDVHHSGGVLVVPGMAGSEDAWEQGGDHSDEEDG